MLKISDINVRDMRYVGMELLDFNSIASCFQLAMSKRLVLNKSVQTVDPGRSLSRFCLDGIRSDEKQKLRHRTKGINHDKPSCLRL